MERAFTGEARDLNNGTNFSPVAHVADIDTLTELHLSFSIWYTQI
jgi:hypothetical protein